MSQRYLGARAFSGDDNMRECAWSRRISVGATRWLRSLLQRAAWCGKNWENG